MSGTRDFSKMNILVVEDDPQVRSLCLELLRENGFNAVESAGAIEALAIMKDQPIDLVLSDLMMPEYDGIFLLKQLRASHPQTLVIIMTAYATVETAVECMKSGAFDYLTKPLNIDELIETVKRALEHRWMSAEIKELRRELHEKYHFDNLVGRSAAMQEVFQALEKIAPTDCTVLIQGETGSGKEVVARAIHYNSLRRERHFVKINCSALTETLMESELFGHEKGAFTGAVARKYGLFETADHGSIFLDEIGDMPSSLQVKVLQVLEHGVFRRVGSTEEQHVNVRVISATNRDLADAVEKGVFRADLYHRLNVLNVTLPPLRDRKEDIPLLLRHFLEKLCPGPAVIPNVAPDAIEALCAYRWPGNVRELHNLVERALVLSNGKEITLREFSPPLQPATLSSQPAPVTVEPASFPSLADLERDLIVKVLKATKDNRTHAASILGITTVTLRKKIKEYNLE